MPEWLCILQFADSACPVGSTSHSFGLESLVFDEDIQGEVHNCPASLFWYLEDSLSESLMIDAVFCREAHTRALQNLSVVDLNQQVSALRMARELRDASLMMGRRFAALAAALHPAPALAALSGLEELHHAVAFGYVLGILSADVDSTVSAFIHQIAVSAISAAQRLLPLGQVAASRISWNLKPVIIRAMEKSREVSFRTVGSFAHLPDLASMRHPCLQTRLFIS